MKHNPWIYRVSIAIIVCVLIIAGTWFSSSNASNVSIVAKADGRPLTVTFAKDDMDSYWNSQTATKIHFSDAGIQVSGNGTMLEDNVVTILYGGVYELSGSMNDGQLLIKSNDSRTVHLVFNGINLTSENSAPIYINQAEKTIITLAEGSENILTDGSSYLLEGAEDDEPATIFSKDDLVFNGTGKLTIKGNTSHGIVSKDDLVFISGIYDIEAVEDGIRGRDSIAIKDGNFTIHAQNDGLKSNNDLDEDKGYIYIENGQFNITSGHDGIQGFSNVVLLDGEYQIVANGGYVNGPERSEEMMGMPGGGMRGGMPFSFDESMMQSMLEQFKNDDGTFTLPDGSTVTEDEAEEMIKQFSQRFADGQNTTEPSLPTGDVNSQGIAPAQPNGEASSQGAPPAQPIGEASSQNKAPTTLTETIDQMNQSINDDANEETTGVTESDSYKGIKSDGAIWIENGVYNLDTADDAIHSGAALTILQGDFTISTGDDALHSETDLILYDGEFNILNGYEGIEGVHVTIYDGNYTINVTDDGINTASGTAEEFPMMNFNMNQNFNNSSNRSESEDTQTADNRAISVNTGETMRGSGQRPQRPDQQTFSQASDENGEVNNSAETNGQSTMNNFPGRGPGGGGMGGGMMESSDGSSLNIYGGNIIIYSSGDGIDSNGDITIYGGNIVAVTDSDIGGDGGIDTSGSLKILGGTILGAGPFEAKPIEESTQASLYYSASEKAEEGSTIEIYEGETLIYSVTLDSKFSNVLFSSDKLKADANYTLKINDNAQELTAQISPEGAGTMGFGGGGGFPGGGFGQGIGGFGRGQRDAAEANTDSSAESNTDSAENSSTTN